ncbi:MAG: alkaline phosphatase family protein [Planctomycetota bacterium]
MRASLRIAPSLLLVASACQGPTSARVVTTDEAVGRHQGHTATPVNQVLTPHGKFVDLPGLRPQVVALTPNGERLLVSGKTNALWVLDPVDGHELQRVPLPGDRQTSPPTPASPNILRPDKSDQVSYTGLLVSPARRRVYLSDVSGTIKVFTLADDDEVRASHTLQLPEAKAPRRDAEIPSGLALSADETKLYVCANLSNQLLELDADTGAVLRSFPVGVAPYTVVLAGGHAFVSNWGGRRPDEGDLVGPAGRGTVVRVDATRHIASEGSVSLIDLESGEPVREIVTGLHASALAVTPDGRHVVCANAAADTLSVLDAHDGHVVETIWMRAKPSDLLSASPNALAFAPDGRTLYVANGTQNAIAVVRFDPDDRESALLGLIPVGWFPGALVLDSTRRQLCVANVKGLGFGRPRKSNEKPEFNTHQYHGSLSLVPLPGAAELAGLSARVATNLRAPAIAQALLPARPGQPPRVVPERSGEPSLIEHVVYVLKENRTYDQVLGDLPQGNGDPELCVFPERVTPNQHALARNFVLLDNTYCAGILSADGHEWSTSAFVTDYLEKSFAGFPRSYPDGMGDDEKDALAYAPSGFLWDHAIAKGLSLRNYGEFCQPRVHWRDPARQDTIHFLDCYRTWKGENDDVVFGCEPVVPSLAPYSPSGYVGWDMAVPDQYRADFVLRELAGFEEKGEFPRLTLICLPNDHTSGTGKDRPTPASQVADNDLALGRIVEGLSHSRFWPKMAIFVIEDDPQAGWDHVSGYRTTAYVASPYAKRGAVVGTQYNTTSILRTIEQILGLPPMNAFDASATPMFDCFQDTPDLAPFVALPSNVPFDEMNPGSTALADPALRADAERSAQLDFSRVDRAPEDVLNRILWRAMKGSSVPYPEWAVSKVDDDDDD